MKPIICLIRPVQMYRIEAEQIKIRITPYFNELFWIYARPAIMEQEAFCKTCVLPKA
jgi:hypothetical protein